MPRYYRRSPERIIVLSEEIDSVSSSEVIKDILEINDYDDYKKAKEPKYEPSPIRLIVNTIGGDVYQGFSIIGVIENSLTPIHGETYGLSMSMGLLIYASCHYRIASRFATFMYHEISYPIPGQESMSYHKQEAKETQRLQGMYDSYLISRSKLKKEKLNQVRLSREDWYIPAKEALKLGIVDEIV
jgi:ATP-dependent Clp protease protease subunit